MDFSKNKVKHKGHTALAQSNKISEEVNSYLANAMDIFAKVAKKSIQNTVGEKFKKIDNTYTKTSKSDGLNNKIEGLREQLANASSSK